MTSPKTTKSPHHLVLFGLGIAVGGAAAAALAWYVLIGRSHALDPQALIENHLLAPTYDTIQSDVIFIPGGTTWIGCVPGDANCRANEFPRFSTQIADLYVDKHEVTVSEYQLCVAHGACQNADRNTGGCNASWKNILRPGTRLDYPVNCVSLHDATDYCQWAGKRLPNEYEWEHFARPTSTDTYPWGPTAPIGCDRAVLDFGGRGCGRDSMWPVCSKAHGNTPSGICDVGGNAFEWVTSRESESTNTPEAKRTTPLVQSRGGSFYTGRQDPDALRVSFRSYTHDPSFRSIKIGLRCVKDATP